MTSDDYKRLADEYQAGLDWMRAIEYAANIASIHAHHALWNGLLPYGWDEAIEQFGRNLANAIAKAIKAEVPKRLAAEPVKAGEPVAWLVDWFEGGESVSQAYPTLERAEQVAKRVDSYLVNKPAAVITPVYTHPPAPPASDVLREALKPFARIPTAYTHDIDDDALVFEYEGGAITLGDLRRVHTALAAANQSDGGDKAGSSPTLANKGDSRPHAHGMMPVGDNAANMDGTDVGLSDAELTDLHQDAKRTSERTRELIRERGDNELRRNLRHWKEECGKLHSQIAAKNAALDTALGALQIARVWVHKELKRAPVLRAIEQIKRVRQ